MLKKRTLLNRRHWWKKIPTSIFSIQCKILLMYVCRERVLNILETWAPFSPPPTHTHLGNPEGGGLA